MTQSIAFTRNGKTYCYVIKQLNNEYILLEKQDGTFKETFRANTLEEIKQHIDYYDVGSNK